MVEDAGDLPDVSRYCCNRFKIIVRFTFLNLKGFLQNGAYMVAVSYCVFIMANLGIRFYKSAEVCPPLVAYHVPGRMELADFLHRL